MGTKHGEVKLGLGWEPMAEEWQKLCSLGYELLRVLLGNKLRGLGLRSEEEGRDMSP